MLLNSYSQVRDFGEIFSIIKSVFKFCFLKFDLISIWGRNHDIFKDLFGSKNQTDLDPDLGVNMSCLSNNFEHVKITKLYFSSLGFLKN